MNKTTFKGAAIEISSTASVTFLESLAIVVSTLTNTINTLKSSNQPSASLFFSQIVQQQKSKNNNTRSSCCKYFKK